MNELSTQNRNELYTKEIDKETESSSMRRCAYIHLYKIEMLKSFEATKDIVITISLQKNRKEKLFSQPFSSNQGNPLSYDINREFSLFYLHCVKYHRDPILRIAVENTRPKTFTRHRSIAATLVSMQQVLQYKFKGPLTLYTCHNQNRVAIGYIYAEISTEYLDDGDDHFESSDEEDIDDEVIEQSMTPNETLGNSHFDESNFENRPSFRRLGHTIKQIFKNYSSKEVHYENQNLSDEIPRDLSNSTISASSLLFDETKIQCNENINDFMHSMSEPNCQPFLFLFQNSSSCYKLSQYLATYKNDDGIKWSQHLGNVDELSSISIIQQLITAYKTLCLNTECSIPHIIVYLMGTDRFINKFISTYLSILSERPKITQALLFLPLPNDTIPVLCEMLFRYSSDYMNIVYSLNNQLNTYTYQQLSQSNQLYTIIQSLLNSSTTTISIPIGQAVLHCSDSYSSASHLSQIIIPLFHEVQFGKHLSIYDLENQGFYSFKNNVDIWISDPFSSSGSALTRQITIPSHKLTNLFTSVTRQPTVFNTYLNTQKDSFYVYYHIYIPPSQKNRKKWFITKALLTNTSSSSDASPPLSSFNSSNSSNDGNINYFSSSLPNMEHDSIMNSHDIDYTNWLEGQITKIICTFDEPGEKIYIDGVEYSNCTVIEINGKWNSRIKELQFNIPCCLDNEI